MVVAEEGRSGGLELPDVADAPSSSGKSSKYGDSTTGGDDEGAEAAAGGGANTPDVR